MDDLELRKTLEAALFGIFNPDEIGTMIRNYQKIKEVIKHIDNKTHRGYKLGKCSQCQRENRPIVTGKNSVAICDTCYQKNRRADITKHRACSKCGEVKYVAGRTESGEPLCTSCNFKLRKKKQLPS